VISSLNILRGKGKAKSFPFFLYFLLISNCFAQLGIEGWLHPRTTLFFQADSSSFIEYFHNQHIGLINFNDSLRITESDRGLRFNNRYENGNIIFTFHQHESIAKFLQSEFSYLMKNKYNEISLGYELRAQNISTGIRVSKISSIEALSPSLQFNIQVLSDLHFGFTKSIKNEPFGYRFEYRDFIYNLNRPNILHNKNIYRLALLKNRFKIHYKYEKDDWGLSSNINFIPINLDSGIKEIKTYSGCFLIDAKNKLSWSYVIKNNYFKLDLLNDSNKSFLNFNNYTNDSDNLSLSYKLNASNYEIELIFLKKSIDFYTSIRLWPSRISSDLYDYFNLVSRVVNNSTGELKQEMFSINVIMSHYNYVNLFFQLDWIRDEYDVNSDTKSLSLFGLPIANLSNNQNLNMIGKDAINLELGCKVEKSNWVLILSFSQHMPYIIKYREKLMIGEKEDERSYGGGLFKFKLLKYLK
tara:strand:+ start:267 stop:1673 length:1407 start_codon:yes stop_codon:yes gene_type:complete